jgi:hypothetical protein
LTDSLIESVANSALDRAYIIPPIQVPINDRLQAYPAEYRHVFFLQRDAWLGVFGNNRQADEQQVAQIDVERREWEEWHNSAAGQAYWANYKQWLNTPPDQKSHAEIDNIGLDTNSVQGDQLLSDGQQVCLPKSDLCFGGPNSGGYFKSRNQFFAFMTTFAITGVAIGVPGYFSRGKVFYYPQYDLGIVGGFVNYYEYDVTYGGQATPAGAAQAWAVGFYGGFFFFYP